MTDHSTQGDTLMHHPFRANVASDQQRLHFFIANFIRFAKIKLVDFYLVSVANRNRIKFLQVPFHHLLHVFDHGRGPQIRGSSRRPRHPKRLEPPAAGCEGQHVRQVGIIFPMQVGNKDIVEFLPLPNWTMMQVPAWSRRGGQGQLPTNETRISSGPMSSVPG